MFTGIIEDVGVVERAAAGADGGRALTFRTALDPASIATGDSIACSGVCLTVTQHGGGRFTVDAGPETLARTTIGELKPGSEVNLERALTLATRLGGHLVQGHVDGVGTLRSLVRRENAHDLLISAPPDVLRLVAARGSIAVDGISLTVTRLEADAFGVSIIPQTWRATALARKGLGAALNLEVDLIARYVARLLEPTQPAPGPAGGMTEAFLREHGF